MTGFQHDFSHGDEAIRPLGGRAGDEAMAVDVHGERFVLHAARAVSWPARQALLVADVHLGKEAALRRRGQAVPDHTQREDLARLSALVEATGASTLIVLGDLFHSPQGIDAGVTAAFAAWRARHPLRILLVEGNHDRRLLALAARWGITVAGDAFEDAGFHFTHGIPPRGARFAWSGHYHPCLRLRNAVDGLRLPAFYLDDKHAILPAFGGATGSHPLPARARGLAVAIADGALYPFRHGLPLPEVPARKSDAKPARRVRPAQPMP